MTDDKPPLQEDVPMSRFRIVDADETSVNDAIEEMHPEYDLGAWSYIAERDEIVLLFMVRPDMGGLGDLFGGMMAGGPGL